MCTFFSWMARYCNCWRIGTETIYRQLAAPARRRPCCAEERGRSNPKDNLRLYQLHRREVASGAPWINTVTSGDLRSFR